MTHQDYLDRLSRILRSKAHCLAMANRTLRRYYEVVGTPEKYVAFDENSPDFLDNLPGIKATANAIHLIYLFRKGTSTMLEIVEAIANGTLTDEFEIAVCCAACNATWWVRNYHKGISRLDRETCVHFPCLPPVEQVKDMPQAQEVAIYLLAELQNDSN